MDHRYVVNCLVFFPYVNLQMMSGHQTFTIGHLTIIVEMMQIVRTTDIIHNATSTDLPPIHSTDFKISPNRYPVRKFIHTLYHSKIPSNILSLTHGPPHKILDEVIYPPGKNVGCEALRAAFQNGALKPRLHVFGHIHEAHGAQFDGSGAVETVHVNASSWPVGRRPKRVGKRIDDIGIDDDDDDAPFQPVIVDLLDHISE